MTTFTEVSDITISHFLTEWNNLTYVAIENTKEQSVDDVSWVRFIVKQNEPIGQTLGEKNHRRFKRLGMILFQVFTPLYSATYEGNELCEKIINIFEGENINGVSYYNAFSSPTGPSGDWYQYNGSVEFSFNENK